MVLCDLRGEDFTEECKDIFLDSAVNMVFVFLVVYACPY